MGGLVIETGKYYKSRGGEKCYCVEQNTNGFWVIEGESGFYTVDHQGRFWGHYEENSIHDIIAEWTEPKRIKGWVNVYGRMPYLTREEADRIAGRGRKACVYIDIEEGHGLDNIKQGEDA